VKRPSTKSFVVAGVLVALLVAGVASFYASSHPDGLEYVAEKTGFLDTAEESPTSDSPFADYSTRGVDDERVSVAITGLVGVAVTLLAAGGLFWALRRRGDSAADADDPARDDVDART
jgi:cobalt/nickel transport system permease protein/cobalt/nickel transport protein